MNDDSDVSDMETRNRVNDIIGERIKELRKENEMSQEHLADLLQITTADLKQIESGRMKVDLGIITRLYVLFQKTAGVAIGRDIASEQDSFKDFIDISPMSRDMWELNRIFFNAPSNNIRQKILAFARSVAPE